MVRYSDKYQLARPNGWRNGQVGVVWREMFGAPDCVLIRWPGGGISSAAKSDLVVVTEKQIEKLKQGDLF